MKENIVSENFNKNDSTEILKKIYTKSKIHFGLTTINIEIYSDFNISSNTVLKDCIKSQIIYFDYEIHANCSKILINNEIHNIPNFYNKDMIRIRDNKTLEMIFLQIIYNKLYKSKLK
mgnify:CR=1 FL=1